MSQEMIWPAKTAMYQQPVFAWRPDNEPRDDLASKDGGVSATSGRFKGPTMSQERIWPAKTMMYQQPVVAPRPDNEPRDTLASKGDDVSATASRPDLKGDPL